MHISKMGSERRIAEWLTTRVLLAEMVDRELSIGNNSLGKPFIKNDPINISISHTRDYVAILLNEKFQVGVDIETISDRIFKIKDRFVSDNEFIAPDNSTIHLLLHWSAKETLFKLLDEEEVDFKEHLQVQHFTPLQKGTFEAYESKTKNRKTYRINYEVFPDAVLTWAIDK